MKKASAKIRKKVKVKFCRELNTMEERFDSKKRVPFQDSCKQIKRK